jgi:hypothetical protein
MGHIRLGRLPRTYRWKEVVRLLTEEGSVSEIAEASFTAAHEGLKRVPRDDGFTHVLTTIFQFIDSLRSKDSDATLREADFPVFRHDSVFDLIGSLRQKIDSDLGRKGMKSDVSEIAQNSFAETLFKRLSATTASLFETSLESARNSLRDHVSGNRFKGLMHDFFSTFTRRYLSYYLSRELSNHVGPGGRFPNIEEHKEFNRAFDLYVSQAIRIADEFTPGWFGKAAYERKLAHEDVSRFAHVAFKKITKEFTRTG